MIRNHLFFNRFWCGSHSLCSILGGSEPSAKKHGIRNTFGGSWRRSWEELGSKTADRTHSRRFWGVRSHNVEKPIVFYMFSQVSRGNPGGPTGSQLVLFCEAFKNQWFLLFWGGSISYKKCCSLCNQIGGLEASEQVEHQKYDKHKGF